MSFFARVSGALAFFAFLGLATLAAAVGIDRALGTGITTVPAAILDAFARWDYRSLTDKAFAAGLAFGIVALGAGFAAAFLVRHVSWVAFRLKHLRDTVAKAAKGGGFAANYDAVARILSGDRLVRHAANQYFNAISDQRAHGGGLRASMPAAAFLNGSVARQHYPLLQIMPVIPGTFVGIGLLLTFVGIVIALYDASAGMGGDAARMTVAVQSLMQVASFKFATSIAGLFVSLCLGLLFKLYSVWIDGSFHRLAAELDRHVLYESPQALSARMARSLDAQVEELKAINNDRFFARMGEHVMPGVEAALTRAIAPVVTTLQDTTRQIADSSRSATSEAISSIATTVHGAAGEELRALASTLGDMRDVLERLQGGIAGSGQAVADKLVAAASEMARELQRSGTVTAFGIETSMSEVLARIDQRFSSLSDKLDQAAQVATAQSAAIGESARTVSVEMQNHIREASLAAATQLRGGLADVLGEVRGALGALERTALAASQGLERQSTALGRAAETTANASTTFREAAEDMRRTAEPVRAATREVAEATVQLRGSISEATTTIRTDIGEASRRWAEAQDAARLLATELGSQANRIRDFWESYETRFASVDRDLAGAVTGLGEQTRAYQDSVREFVEKLDKQLAKSTDSLATVVSELGNQIEDFNDARRPLAAAE